MTIQEKCNKLYSIYDKVDPICQLILKFLYNQVTNSEPLRVHDVQFIEDLYKIHFKESNESL